MATPESLIEAFGRGLMQGAMAGQAPEGKAKKDKPAFVKHDDVKRAVQEVLTPLLEEQTPSAQELNLFTQDIERAEPDDMTQLTLRKIAEAQERAARNGQVEDEGTFDPNLPQGAPWTSPR